MACAAAISAAACEVVNILPEKPATSLMNDCRRLAASTVSPACSASSARDSFDVSACVLPLGNPRPTTVLDRLVINSEAESTFTVTDWVDELLLASRAVMATTVVPIGKIGGPSWVSDGLAWH